MRSKQKGLKMFLLTDNRVTEYRYITYYILCIYFSVWLCGVYIASNWKRYHNIHVLWNDGGYTGVNIQPTSFGYLTKPYTWYIWPDGFAVERFCVESWAIIWLPDCLRFFVELNTARSHTQISNDGLRKMLSSDTSSRLSFSFQF